MQKLTIKLPSLCLLLLTAMATFAQQPGYFRDPNLHGNKLVFLAQGDLWLQTIDADTPAKRLTSHANLERSPRFSPNGDRIAFVASYNNAPAVHIMPSEGGIARQVSFELGRTKLHGWIDNKNLLISTTSNTGMHSSWVLKRVNIDSLKVSSLPVSDAVEGVMANNGNTLVFVQFGLQISTDNANHYKGGAAGELWQFNLDDKEARLRSGEHQGSIRSPMLYQAQTSSTKLTPRIFFISNQNSVDNIWSVSLTENDFVQHTRFEDWPVRNASIAGNKIVFQHGADIKIYNISNGKVSDVNIALQSDFVDLRTQYLNTPLQYFESASASNNGNSALVLARGKLALAHSSKQRLINIASDPTARLRHAVLSLDGKSVYAVSDASGDYEIWRFDAFGGTQAEQLTQGGNILKTSLLLSPDGNTLAYTEKNGALWLLDLATKQNKRINELLNSDVYSVVFSKDSRYIAVSLSKHAEERSRIYLLELASGQSAMLTSDKYNAFSPSFSHDMQWLYFLSDRAFNATPSHPWGDRNMGVSFDKRSELFAIALTQDATFPFAAESELDSPAALLENTDTSDPDTLISAQVNFKNIQSRLWQVDVPANNYEQVIASENGLIVLQEEHLKSLAFEHGAELTDMTSKVRNISLSANLAHLLVNKGRADSTELFVIPADTDFPSNIEDHKVNVSSWVLAIEPQQEWQQLFKDAWLMHRDSLFDANMRGIDWPATKQKYMPLLARLTERSELNDIFEQMMGELNALHSQVRGGDLNDDPSAPKPATLGASFSDTKNGVRIDTIYQYDIEIIKQAPPLSKPGVNANAGDIVLALNNIAINSVADLQQALYNTQGQQVLLRLKRGKDIINTIVEPEASNRETRLRYQHWVQKNLNKVNETDTDIGYLHLYAMGGNDLASFARDFYAQYEKQGLIIDVRRNRGGNIDSIIIEKLLRRAWSFWQYPNGTTGTNMQQTFRGHLVVLADQFTYSDGETFTAGIKALELGTVIGKKTAGAGVWLSGGNRLVDNGIARVAEYPVHAMDGRWITEGEGIAPHVEVDNLPHATFKGEDAQLNAAIALLKEKLQSRPVPALKPNAFPPVEKAADDVLVK